MATLDDIRTIVSGMGNTSEREAWGLPSFYVGDKMFARATDSDDQLAVRVPLASRDEVIASAPDAFSVTDAYAAYPWLLVDLSSADQSQLTERLSAAAATRS